jgi:hypothetical protein
MFAFFRAAANSGPNVSGEFGGDDATDRRDYRAVIKGSMDIEDRVVAARANSRTSLAKWRVICKTGYVAEGHPGVPVIQLS